MEFRAPKEIKDRYEVARDYLTSNLDDPDAGRTALDELIQELGNPVRVLPSWHPILRNPNLKNEKHISSIHNLDAYSGADHTVYFVGGFVTCPYSEEAANRLVDSIRHIEGLWASRLHTALYSDSAFPVVATCLGLSLEADGTIASRDALKWFLEWLASLADGAEVAETWWNIRDQILGRPSGARSSICVNQHVGRHMRKILETINESGVFGPVMEESLDMLPRSKRERISETLIRSALRAWDKDSENFIFELRGESCSARIVDLSDDGKEFYVTIDVGNGDLRAGGYLYPERDQLECSDPTGKRKVAEKFV